MANKIVVDPSQLRGVAKSMQTTLADFKEQTKQLDSIVKHLSENWTGADNQEFTNQINIFGQDFLHLQNILNEYINFLNNSAEKYQKTQSDIVSKVSKLSTRIR